MLLSKYEFTGIERLYGLMDKGYEAAYIGGEEIPLEVQFIISGSDLKEWGKNINLVGVVTRGYTTFQHVSEIDGEIRIFKIPEVIKKYSMKMNESDDFFTRMEKARKFFLEKMDNFVDNNLLLNIFIGIYFDEEGL
jgi:hypothetical protein